MQRQIWRGYERKASKVGVVVFVRSVPCQPLGWREVVYGRISYVHTYIHIRSI